MFEVQKYDLRNVLYTIQQFDDDEMGHLGTIVVDDDDEVEQCVILHLI